MTRRYFYLLAAITVAVVFLMAFLHFTADNPQYRKKGFTRTAINTSLVRLHSVNQKVADVAGIYSGSLYLVTNNPTELLVADTGFQQIQPLRLNIEINNKWHSNFTTTLLDGSIYIAGHNVPAIARYDLLTQQTTIHNTDRAFSRIAILNDHSAMLRGFNASFDDELIRKMDMPAGVYQDEKDITDKTEGGGFVTDGMLNYDHTTGRVVYNFFYSNRLLFLDTNLNLLQTAHTIDTFKTYTASAKAVQTSRGVSFTFSKPPTLLNLHSCVSNGKLFMYSRLQADNEDVEVFKNNMVIDVYDVTTGGYNGSLYVPGKKMQTFRVFENLLVGIYTDSLVTYQIREKI